MAPKSKLVVALATMAAALGCSPAMAQDVQSEPLAPPTQQLQLPELQQQPQNPGQQPEQGQTLGQDIEQPKPDLGQQPQDYQDRIENKVAEFYGIDKITGRIITFDVYIDETVRFGALHVTPRVCYSRPVTETPKTTTFVEVDEITLDRQIRRIFTGWMFADSPGLNAIEHPVYDIWLKDCKMTSDEAPPPS